MKSLFFVICLIVGINTNPTIDEHPECLFFIKRNTNKNIVVYESNFDTNGYLDKKQPIKISWIMKEKNGEREELSYIERKLAYGIKVVTINEHKHKIILTADKTREFILEQTKAYKANITSNINDTIINVNNLYIKLNEKSVWPKVDYIILSGTESLSNKKTSKKLFLN